MTITNHILAGAIIGLVVADPVAAVALALASHFIMDALPHFGYAGNRGYGEALKHKMSYMVSVFALFASLVVVGVLAVCGQWFALCVGLVAASPDVLGAYNWLAYEKRGAQAAGWLKWVHVKFHRAIQWCERPWGVWVEVGVFVALSWMLVDLL